VFWNRPVLKEPDQVTHPVMAMLWVAKRKVVVDFISVAPTVARLRYVARFFEVVDDLRRSSFGDSDRRRDVSESDARISGDAFEHMRMVRYEPPRMVIFSGT
jgi:hypothetical protein